MLGTASQVSLALTWLGPEGCFCSAEMLHHEQARQTPAALCSVERPSARWEPAGGAQSRTTAVSCTWPLAFTSKLISMTWN